jgi:hypothetical protein
MRTYYAPTAEERVNITVAYEAGESIYGIGRKLGWEAAMTEADTAQESLQDLTRGSANE